MKKSAITFLLSILAIGTISGAAYAFLGQNPERTPVVFYEGHTHGEQGEAVGAPQHSGGTDKYGCHNASVPYHCH